MRTKEKKSTSSGERPDLDRRYGAIGISAVAAAVRYQGETGRSATKPVVVAVEREEREDVAA
jgi:hypothetical protein